MNHLSLFSRRDFLGWCGMAATGCIWNRASRGQTTSPVLNAGAARVDISPEPGVSLAGHMQDRKATHVHDPLFARCLVLENSNTSLLLMTVDSCAVYRELFDAAKARITAATGIPANAQLMAATHTHTAPTAVSVFQSEPDQPYLQILEDGIVEAATRAWSERVPAQCAVGRGAVPDEVFNRRWFLEPGHMSPNPFGGTDDQVRMNPPRGAEYLARPAGPVDPEVTVLAARRTDGKPLALFANYGLHYVGGTDGGAVSADYFGCFANSLEQLLTGNGADAEGCVVMLSNGASGDVNNINFREPGQPYAPYEKMQVVADAVAAETLRVYQQLEFSDDVALGAATQDIALGVRKPDAEELARANAMVAAAGAREMQSMEEIYARETVLLDAFPDEKRMLLQAVRIGDALITAIPCEVFAEIGLALKSASPLAVPMTVSLANGYFGYLPTAAQHKLGGYETWRARSSFLEPDAADAIQTTLTSLMSRVQ